ncbi:MAG: hypothetical protein LBE33_09225 [Zoogloeaceae bacterium]|jgi:hypothetical protein|nr:hypothetical protein [Zoogloeaceae bacterium]
MYSTDDGHGILKNISLDLKHMEIRTLANPVKWRLRAVQFINTDENNLSGF